MISSPSKDGANINQRQVLPARAGSWGTLRLTDGDFRPSGGKIDTKNDSMSLWSHDDILDVRGLNPRLGPLFADADTAFCCLQRRTQNPARLVVLQTKTTNENKNIQQPRTRSTLSGA